MVEETFKNASLVQPVMSFSHKKEGEVTMIPWPLLLWTVFEIIMNAWILITMLKVGVAK